MLMLYLQYMHMPVLQLLSLLNLFRVVHYTNSLTWRRMYQSRNYIIDLIFKEMIKVTKEEKIIGL